MKKIFLSFLILTLFETVKSQVIVNIQLPQVGLYLNSQLWNMSLTNAGTTATNIRIDMILSDAQNGDMILSGASREFVLATGTKQIQLTDLIPIQYNLLNYQYGASATADGFLPIGNFVVCYSIFQRNSEEYEKVAEDCETILVEPASPPLLVFPEDDGIIDENRPVFTWIPPAPSFLFSNLSYELILVEVLNNQQPSEAVQFNLPLLQQNNVAQTFLPYPSNLNALDTGKLYAWRITANNNGLPVSNSEVFSFRLYTAKDSLKLHSSLYTVLKKPGEIKFAVSRGKLFYEYTNMDNTDSITLQLEDITNAVTKKISLPNPLLPVKPGQNFNELDLTMLQGMVSNHIYLFTATSKSRQSFALKFIYQNPE
ncbi:MAG: hypothetical protein QM687_14440 [Ferruginibacter sp.]